MVCSEHFAEECFERSLHVKGSQGTLRPGSVPFIWMNKNSQEPSTSRSVRTCKKNFTLRSTPPQSGPASSLSTVNEDINDSSAQVPASDTLPTFFQMMTSTPNMNITSNQIPISSFTDDDCQKDQRLTRTPKDTTSEATNYIGCPECASLKKERKKLRRKVRDMDEKISRLKDRLQKNQEDWAISFKELEYQQQVLVTSDTQTSADDLKGAPTQEQKTTEALE
ncbi:hypothetical protein P5673_031534 [Acropora cervicornis]|uniref:THAP-type domain-containing protein n=1 Tax=Acropora cervicornis TaxID=6130 RepID=A0AAD9PSJ5_ACRCE|nr:hypothetical protein P5673_031534 [Acropora cervicornis]